MFKLETPEYILILLLPIAITVRGLYLCYNMAKYIYLIVKEILKRKTIIKL
jgi:hypothetical protein